MLKRMFRGLLFLIPNGFILFKIRIYKIQGRSQVFKQVVYILMCTFREGNGKLNITFAIRNALQLQNKAERVSLVVGWLKVHTDKISIRGQI